MWIRNGLVVDPANGLEETADILIEDGKIAKIIRQSDKAYEPNEIIDESEPSIDAKGCIVSPGLVDVHVHFRDPGFTYKEDIETGAKAALKGGFTSVILMANTKPAVDNVQTLQYVLDKGKNTDLHIYTCAAVTRGLDGKELTDMKTLYENGAAGFTDDGIPIMNEKLMENAMIEAASLGVPISLHEENPQYITNNGINKGTASDYFGIGGSPREAEISLIQRDVQIAARTGVILNIQHISTKEGVEIVRQAKSREGGENIHAEATPHHFSLTQEAVIKHGTLAKMNPPLREESDRQAIIKGLQDGTIEIIATDHAPHSTEEKQKALTEAPSGIIGLETALSLGITNLVNKNQISLSTLISCMSYNPAKMYGLEAGTLSIGANADLVVFALKDSWVVRDFESKSANSPFVGETLQGVVKYTIVDGKIVYQN